MSRVAYGPDPFPCRYCGRTVRPSHTKPEDYPGVKTLSYGGHGSCGACAWRARKQQGAPIEPIPDPALEQAREARNLAYIERGLESYLNRRRERLAA